ncbi:MULTISPECIES: S1 family peptidase [unclassified Streptomyces]|uniref:S1 family peptidase n=1 Tax=unclassified Streptomyces TaxID=2593676 RepID=UPI0037F4D990
MSHKRIPKRKIVFAGGGAVAIAAAAILLPNANASQGGEPETTPKKVTAAAAGDLASQIAAQLGDAFAGSYYDSAKQQIVINVVGDNNKVELQAKQAGAVVRNVKNSSAQLKAASQTLKAQATIPGTAWSVDPKTNQIQVTADRTVTGAKWNQIESTVKSLGSDVARIKRSAGEFKPLAAGGDAIFGGGARCSLGFNVVTADGAPGFLTAGHCGVAAAEWSDDQNGQPVATIQDATFAGGGDFALAAYDDPATEVASTVDTGDGQIVDIAAAAEAAVGQEVIRMGSTTGLADGAVTGLDATVNYGNGDIVNGLIQTDVCAEPGDSGGPLFTADGGAIGLTSGGSGDCTVGGETFFQPVTTALEAVGAQIGAGDAGAGDGAADAGAGDGAADAGAGDGAADAGAGDGAADAGAGDGAADAGAGDGAADAGAGDGVADAGAANAGAGDEGAAAAGAGDGAADAGAGDGAADAGAGNGAGDVGNGNQGNGDNGDGNGH